MSAATTKFPITHQELLELRQGGLMRFSASFADYWSLLEKVQYKADYSNQEIIALSYETNAHSKIVTEMMFLLRKIFDDPRYSVHDPNRPVYIPEVQAVHNPDCSVVLESAKFFEYQAGMNAETTPMILVEVLSKTTRNYDYSEKLPHYQQIPSLRQIIYLDSTKMFVSLYERTDESPEWINSEYCLPGDGFMVQGQALSLADIYRKVEFG